MDHEDFSISRRKWLKGAVTIGGITAGSSLLSACSLFYEYLHGVASGDPQQDSVILWTRVTPKSDVFVRAEVRWQVALDDMFVSVVSEGVVTTNASKDFTVKVDAQGLQAETAYYYRFIVDNCISPVGRTLTLPAENVEKVRFGIVSCSNYPQGYFNVYNELSKQDIDYVLHLGDYIYEYGPGTFDDEDAVAQQRMVDPPRELLSLTDYRKRYAQYRSDGALKKLHSLRPFICVWDDHEVANDAYEDGAQNHNDNEGSFQQRRMAALQAYYEWMPIREQADSLQIFRQFSFGNLLDLYMLDTRLRARDKQLSHSDYINNIIVAYDYQAADADIRNPNRELLGVEQMQWLQNQLAQSSSTWQVFGQQVLMARMEVPWRLASLFEIGVEAFTDGQLQEFLGAPIEDVTDPLSFGPRWIGYNLDAWDGYYAEREKIFETIESLDLNVINLAGDTHNAWASNLSNVSGESVGVEFATASVSSPGISQYLGTLPFLNELFVNIVEDLKFANVYDRGFLVLELTHEQAEAEWVFVNSIKSPIYFVNAFGKKLKVYPGAGNRKIVEA